LREDDKKERRGLGEGSHLEENWEKRAFWKLSQGNIVVGNFGLGRQEIARIPRARELARLFLVGWEVNIPFGKLGRIINNEERG
jgi:hypothetical protein